MGIGGTNGLVPFVNSGRTGLHHTDFVFFCKDFVNIGIRK